MAEFLDIVDMKGNPTGAIVSREEAHEKGILHRTSHVWILRKVTDRAGSIDEDDSDESRTDKECKNGEERVKIEVLLQKRSACKDSYPGCYDISSAGHIPAGCGFCESALRELSEELGITGVSEDDLIFCGQRYIVMDNIFHGKPFHDRQVSNIYKIWLDISPKDLKLQEEEVESVCWMNLDECKKAVVSNEVTFPNCLYLEELEML